MNRYRKRKIFAITFIVIAFLSFGLTRFIWNVEINCEEKIDEKIVLGLLSEFGIDEGKLISKVQTAKAINEICMKIDEVSWVGIKIKGTNVIVSIEKAVPKPEIIDESTPCDIVSDKDAIITKITARNGTAVAKIGDEVKAGDILIKGIMEGKYTQERYVHADGEILAKVSYKIEEEAELKQCYYEPTEKAYNNFRIKFNNFEINFNKRLPNFKNYDTIETNKKLKLFSNFYIPVEFKKVTYKEKKIKTKEYTTEELSEELQEKLKSKLLDQNNLSEKDVIEMVPVITPTETGIKLNLTCITEEKIGVQVTY